MQQNGEKKTVSKNEWIGFISWLSDKINMDNSVSFILSIIN